jgi:N-acetylglucosamine-6-sulfatase
MKMRWVAGLVAAFFSSAAQDQPPNFVIVTLDDVTLSEAAMTLPLTRAAIGSRSVTFSNFFVEDALCAPSRATFLTGQYAHNHGVHVCEIEQPDSGYTAMRRVESSTLAVWLQAAGYRTGLVGKYMNGYLSTAIPAGWTRWFGWNKGDTADGWNYGLNENGTTVSYGSAQSDFATDVEADKASGFVKNSINLGVPFFLYFAPSGGHAPCAYPDRHADLYSDVYWPGPAETSLVDKPPFIQALKTSTSGATEAYRGCLRSLASVDEAVQRIWAAVKAGGQANNTWLILWSDNGYHFGEHALPRGKVTLYDTDLHVPLMIRGPGLTPRTEAHMVGNADFAPTILELAGLDAPVTIDGTSLVPLLLGPYPTTWRHALPARHWWANTQLQAVYPDALGLRTERWKWIEWATGDRELYDLSADPNELHNQAGDDTLDDTVAQLSALAQQLATCAGDGCRALEQRDVP